MTLIGIALILLIAIFLIAIIAIISGPLIISIIKSLQEKEKEVTYKINQD